jgi:hypothetical protein
VAVLLAAVFVLSFLGLDRWSFLGGLPPKSGTATETTAGRDISRPYEPRTADAGEAGRGFTICALRNLTGIPCPTCGMTRSFCHIARGDLPAAARLQPLGLVVFPMFAVLLVRSTVMAVTGRVCLDRAARLMAWSIVPMALAALTIWGVRLAWMVSDGTAAALWHASILGRLM